MADLIRPTLMAFTTELELKLQEHDENKGYEGWHKSTFSYLLERLFDELEEVVAELVNEDSEERVIMQHLLRQCQVLAREMDADVSPSTELEGELADVANILMMIWDNGPRRMS